MRAGRWTSRPTAGQGEPEPITCNFLLMCSGYYSYDKPHLPEFPGQEDFEGPFFHPQFWPEDLDYAGASASS